MGWGGAGWAEAPPERLLDEITARHSEPIPKLEYQALDDEFVRAATIHFSIEFTASVWPFECADSATVATRVVFVDSGGGDGSVGGSGGSGGDAHCRATSAQSCVPYLTAFTPANTTGLSGAYMTKQQ